MVDVRDVVVPMYSAIDKGMLISEVSPVAKYENNKATGEIAGYKGTFLVTEGAGQGLQLVIKLPVIDKPDWEMMKSYCFSYDKEKSTVYVQNGRMALSLWALDVSEVK